MRLAFDHACAPAAWLSIAAAMVIGKPAYRELLHFATRPTFAKKGQQSVMTMAAGGGDGGSEGTGRCHRRTLFWPARAWSLPISAVIRGWCSGAPGGPAAFFGSNAGARGPPGASHRSKPTTARPPFP